MTLGHHWKSSAQYQRVVEANKKSYREFANIYDKTETCVVSKRLQMMLQKDLDAILARINKPGQQIHALDACGGSGNVSLKLLNRNVNVTLCDISPELIEIFKEKCSKQGFTTYSAVCQEIGEYLSKTERRFDLIVFSSALHHIEDYASILQLSAKRLNPKGFIYTVFDHVEWKFPTFQIIWIDWLLYAVATYPKDLISSAAKKLTKKINRESFSETELGNLTEYHVRHGINDYSLVAFLRKIGLEVVVHQRYFDARHKLFRILLYAIRRYTGFKLLLKAN